MLAVVAAVAVGLALADALVGFVSLPQAARPRESAGTRRKDRELMAAAV